MKLSQVELHHLRLPRATGGGRVALNPAPGAGPAAHLDLLLVQLHAENGGTGLGFAPFPGVGLRPALELLREVVVPLLLKQDPRLAERHFARLSHALQPCGGMGGLAAMAYSAVDIALWDLSARAQQVPLWQLLGGARPAAKAFVSDLGELRQPLEDVPKQIKPLLDEGAIGLLAQIGSGNVEADAERIHDLRHAVGESAWLGVTVRDPYDLTTALGLAQYLQEEMEIDWFEQPLAADDPGVAVLAQKLEVPLVLGAGLDRPAAFRPLLEARLPRLLRADVTRLGGITPWRKVAALAEAFHLGLCPVRLPEVGVQLGCGLACVPMVDFTSALRALWQRPLKFDDGFLPPPDAPGLGLTLDAQALGRFRVEP